MVAHQLQRGRPLRREARSDTISRYAQAELAHIGVLRSAEYALVGFQSRDHQAMRAEFTQQELQRRAVERRVARLEHGEIFRLGFEQFDDRAAAALVLAALLDQVAEIRLPVAKWSLA